MVSHCEEMREKYLSSMPGEVTNSVYAYAWEMGHSNGVSEVEFHYAEVAELVKAAFGAGISFGVRQALG